MSEFSKTALKRFRQMTKDEMVEMLVKISNYAEDQKASSMILMARLKAIEPLVPADKLDEINKQMRGETVSAEQVGNLATGESK